ncbi:MAG: cytochrome c-type biosis protein CcmE [Thermoleophilaceae bacterium]|nr:cytochrome c-type biosis protein CcmE [Thermoleophilaceae bacterium]
MDPSRKRKIRLVVALGLAVVLASLLVWTSFNAATEAKTPSQVLASATPGQAYDLTGKVVAGSIKHDGDTLEFEVQDRDGTTAVPVTYSGVVPDPFRDGREVIVSGTLKDGTFVGRKDSLVTKCPSKFSAEEPA